MRFTVELLPAPLGTFVVIPDEVVAAFKATGRTSVVGTIDGQPFQNQFMPYTFEGEGRKIVMVVNKAVADVARQGATATRSSSTSSATTARAPRISRCRPSWWRRWPRTRRDRGLGRARPVASARVRRARRRGEAARDARAPRGEDRRERSGASGACWRGARRRDAYGRSTIVMVFVPPVTSRL